MAIHLVQRSQAYPAARAAAAADDVLILLGEGCAAVLHGADCCLASHADLQQRGLLTQLPPDCQSIDDVKLVELCAEHNPVVSWTQP